MRIHPQRNSIYIRINNDSSIEIGAKMTEEFRVNGEEILTKVKELIREGNIRNIIIKNDDGKTLINVPLTVGVVGTVIAPQLAAIGAIAALLSHGTIVIEKEE
jgi:hypothetical protein